MSKPEINKKRLFVGIQLDEKLSSEFFNMWKKIKINADKKDLEFKWSSVENLHITLKFLGSTEVERIEEIKNQLESAARETPPLSLKVKGVGAFPSDLQGRTLWIGAQNKVALRVLHEVLEVEFENLGFQRDKLEFKPHITIGKMRNKRNLMDVISSFTRTKLGEVNINRIALFESQLRKGLVHYEVIQSFQLLGEKEAEH